MYPHFDLYNLIIPVARINKKVVLSWDFAIFAGIMTPEPEFRLNSLGELHSIPEKLESIPRFGQSQPGPLRMLRHQDVVFRMGH